MAKIFKNHKLQMYICKKLIKSLNKFMRIFQLVTGYSFSYLKVLFSSNNLKHVFILVIHCMIDRVC